MSPSSSSRLNLLQNSSNVGEKRGDTTRPVSQKVGERKPAIMTLLMMKMAVTPLRNNGEDRKQDNIIVGWWTGENRSLGTSANCDELITWCLLSSSCNSLPIFFLLVPFLPVFPPSHTKNNSIMLLTVFFTDVPLVVSVSSVSFSIPFSSSCYLCRNVIRCPV